MTDGDIGLVVAIPRVRRNKYECDHERRLVRLGRRLGSAMAYPDGYRASPDILAQEDGRPNALGLVEDATLAGRHREARPVGVFWTADATGPDAEILDVRPHEPRRHDVGSRQPADGGLGEIRHFVSIGKALPPGKVTSGTRYAGPSAAEAAIATSQERPGPP